MIRVLHVMIIAEDQDELPKPDLLTEGAATDEEESELEQLRSEFRDTITGEPGDTHVVEHSIVTGAHQAVRSFLL